jgi:hypothetical protein
MSDILDKPLRQVTPGEAFRFYAGSENMNLPAMYAHRLLGRGYVCVVGRDFDRTFPVERLDEAVAFYRMVLEEHGYLEAEA